VANAFTMLPFSAYSVALRNGTSSPGGAGDPTVVLEDVIAPNAVSLVKSDTAILTESDSNDSKTTV
jgi:hypothetical protein